MSAASQLKDWLAIRRNYRQRSLCGHDAQVGSRKHPQIHSNVFNLGHSYLNTKIKSIVPPPLSPDSIYGRVNLARC